MAEKKKMRAFAACLAGLAVMVSACGGNGNEAKSDVIVSESDEERIVNFFSPMEKTDPDAENTARTASDLTVIMAEEELGITMAYRTYTAENYKDKTYDEVTLERARSNMDDLYLLNPDTVQALGEEGLLKDLSGLEGAKNLRDVVKTANVINGKLVAIPQSEAKRS